MKHGRESADEAVDDSQTQEVAPVLDESVVVYGEDVRTLPRRSPAAEGEQKAPEQSTNPSGFLVAGICQRSINAAFRHEDLLQERGQCVVQFGIPRLKQLGSGLTKFVGTVIRVHTLGRNPQAANQLDDRTRLVFDVGFLAAETLRAFLRCLRHRIAVAGLKRHRTHVNDRRSCGTGDSRRKATTDQHVQVLGLKQCGQPRLDVFTVLLRFRVMVQRWTMRTRADDVLPPIHRDDTGRVRIGHLILRSSDRLHVDSRIPTAGECAGQGSAPAPDRAPRAPPVRPSSLALTRRAPHDRRRHVGERRVPHGSTGTSVPGFSVCRERSIPAVRRAGGAGDTA